MTGEIVFHLGDPKTGSTSIQETLATGAWRSDRRVLYTARLNHIPLAKTFYEADKAPQRPVQMRRLAEAVAASDADVAVVSAEEFYHADPAELRQAIAEFMPDMAGRVRLIAYVRPHAERLVSAWAERTKQGGFQGTLAELHRKFVKRGFLRYAPRFERWRAVFGDAFELRPMIRERLREQDVVADFLDFALAGAPVEIERRAPRNVSMTCQDLAMLREFHTLARAVRADRKACSTLGWHFSRGIAGVPPMAPTAAGAERPRLDRALAERVVEAHAEDARALDAAFFEGTPMSDALLAAPGRAVEAAQTIDAEALLGPEGIRITRLWGAVMLTLIAADPDGFVRRLRESHLRELGLLDRPDIAGPPPGRPAAPAALARRLARGARGRLGRIVARVRP